MRILEMALMSAKDSLRDLHKNFPLKSFRWGLDSERNIPSRLIDSLFEDSLSSFENC